MISFQPTEEQQLIQETVAHFAREQIRPIAREADERESIPDNLIQQVWELGLVQATIPESFGGGGENPSALTGALIYEELAWGDLAVALHVLAPRLVTEPVLTLGTEEQKHHILSAYSGPIFTAGTAALTEPRFSFDIHTLATTATIGNGDFLLNGTKCLVPLATTAQYFTIYAQAEDGLGAFLVPQGTPGLAISEREKNMGIKAVATYEVSLENCVIPTTARLSGDLTTVLKRSRVASAALAVGVARAAYEYAREYAKERQAFGTPIAQKQAIAFMLATMAIEIDAARLLTWEAAWQIDGGHVATRESCLAKNYAANTVLMVTDNAVQILGGHGYIRDHLVELWLRNARGFATFDGIAMV